MYNSTFIQIGAQKLHLFKCQETLGTSDPCKKLLSTTAEISRSFTWAWISCACPMCLPSTPALYFTILWRRPILVPTQDKRKKAFCKSLASCKAC